ncbi:hypothetical protein AK830_g3280 [Neonectria ditissima]|uniref:Uncharacterized protein n=1 Tax=Neonectria ditissima TaxID=78410 RepID=A0A0P7BPM6_9HYPO|nr:hypothetical protein AK830_g3280 [Neonectria ditissima]
MPYTSRRLIEYSRYSHPDPPKPSLEPCSPTASESGLHDAFAGDIGSPSNDQQDDCTERDQSRTDLARPLLELYDFAMKTPPLPSIVCRLNSQDGQWDSITRDIIAICYNIFRETTWDDLDEPIRIEFTRMTPDAQRLMGMPYGNIHLFAARIWRILDEAIFQKTKTDSIQWVSPYFKHQNDMLQELRKSKPGAPHSYMTRIWREWDHRSVFLFQGTTPTWSNRIRPECFRQIIADGIGPLFPETPDGGSVLLLDKIAFMLLYWERVFSYCQDYHYFSFGHPGTLETSGFTFRKKLSCTTAMKALDDCFIDEGNTFEGRRVDLIVSPMVMTVQFSRPDFPRIPRMEVPMVVCAGWIQNLENDLDSDKQSERMSDVGLDAAVLGDTECLEDEEGENTSNAGLDATDSGNAEDPDRMEDKEGAILSDAGLEKTPPVDAEDPDRMEDEDGEIDSGNAGDLDQMEDKEDEILSNVGLEKTPLGNAEDPDQMEDEEGENTSNAGLDEIDSGNAQEPDRMENEDGETDSGNSSDLDQMEDEDGETVSGNTDNSDKMKDKRGERTGEARPGNVEEPERRTKKSKT